MLLTLSKRDDEWRKIALKISGNKQTADEIVQEMYIKIHRINPTKANTSYVSYCMYHIYLAMIKNDKKKCDILETSKATIQTEGITDKERLILNRFNSLPWYQKELILEADTKSLRQIEKEFNVDHCFVHRTVKEGLKKILSNG